MNRVQKNCLMALPSQEKISMTQGWCLKNDLDTRLIRRNDATSNCPISGSLCELDESKFFSIRPSRMLCCRSMLWYNSIKLGLVCGLVWSCGMGGVVQRHQNRFGVVQCGVVLYSVVQRNQSRSSVAQCGAISAQPAVSEETQVYSSFSLASTFGLKLRHTLVYMIHISFCVTSKTWQL